MLEQYFGMIIAFFLGVLIGHLLKLVFKIALIIVAIFIILIGIGKLEISFGGGLGDLWSAIQRFSDLFQFGEGVIGFLMGFGLPLFIGVFVGLIFWK